MFWPKGAQHTLPRSRHLGVTGPDRDPVVPELGTVVSFESVKSRSRETCFVRFEGLVFLVFWFLAPLPPHPL